MILSFYTQSGCPSSADLQGRRAVNHSLRKMLKTPNSFNLETSESSIKSSLSQILKNNAIRLSIRTESHGCVISRVVRKSYAMQRLWCNVFFRFFPFIGRSKEHFGCNWPKFSQFVMSAIIPFPPRAIGSSGEDLRARPEADRMFRKSGVTRRPKGWPHRRLPWVGPRMAKCFSKLVSSDAQSDGPTAGGHLQRLAAAQPSLVNWRARATANASAGTSLVMHEPAPM
jgi:hypothetical protein